MASNQSLNVNHLLNFTLPPRQTHVAQGLPRRGRRAGTHLGVWNKEKFVNAQYRFVMKPTGDYTVHFADPDIFFQWQDILQVIIPRSSMLASANGEHISQDEGHTMCPICLSPPNAPRMTKCGHIFCFPCILHYLSISDNKWASCPICTDSISEKHLKAVKWFDLTTRTGDDFKEPHAESSSTFSLATPGFDPALGEGSSLNMRLMERPLITTLALPRSPTWPSDLVSPHRAPFHFLPDVFNYARFMLATPSYLISDLNNDLEELHAEHRTLAGMNDDLGISFVDRAIEKLRRQIDAAAALETPAFKEAVDKALRDQRVIEERVGRFQRHNKGEGVNYSQPMEIPEAFLAASSAGFRHSAGSTSIASVNSHHSPSPSHNAHKRRNINPPPPTTSTYYFYQAASGLAIFLHPLDIKTLLSHFNEYASFPDAITVRVEAVTEGTVNDDLRKRCKYLGHMPEGADVVFVEADLETVVGQEGLKNFEGALKLRRAKRKEKARKDDRARTRAEEREREKEKIATSWSDSRHIVVPPPTEIPEPVEDISPLPPPAHQGEVPGAWGTRSFASALHSTPSPGSGQRSATREPEDEWDVDTVWQELEQRSGGGRRKRSNKLVLGGARGRRR